MEDFNNTTVHLNISRPHIPLPVLVMYWSIISVGPPLIVRNDHVAPIYIINLLISDLIQICSTIAETVSPDTSVHISSSIIYLVSLMANIGFMVCVAVERYLVIAWPCGTASNGISECLCWFVP
ncbi:hypothetical protein Q5P01_021835 [Channa striata]|uniref:G-protein coupled receptors family 1 profile domain-containing protein n=1 Tax=Channa striata TaxID=64152 RepID=A0AA88RYW8_CHASR|nr:hypothetical protein Q5P01_021835 [Channa striata]